MDFNFKSNWKWRESDSDLHQMRRENVFYWIKWTSMVEKRQFHQFSRNCQYLHLRLLIISDIIILENKTRLEVDLSVANFLDEKQLLPGLVSYWHQEPGPGTSVLSGSIPTPGRQPVLFRCSQLFWFILIQKTFSSFLTLNNITIKLFHSSTIPSQQERLSVRDFYQIEVSFFWQSSAIDKIKLMQSSFFVVAIKWK